MLEPPLSDSEWLAQQFESLTSELVVERPSTWSERKRYLPQAATVFAGPYRFSVTPYLREIIDCMSVDSPVREVVLQKGVQIGATVGVLENLIGYYIDHVATAPIMWVTADAELAKLRLDASIIPMLQFSGLLDRITPSDETNARKTGKTDKKLEWSGGGFLIPFGAVNANKLRSISIRVMLRDEVDGWKEIVGKDGDPMKLTADRCAAFEEVRKIFDASTPTIKGHSKINRRYLLGDQRKYYVCCLRCGFPQVLCWRETSNETGEVFGIVWETLQGRLVPESVRYVCKNCGHGHTNNDKTRLLSPDHGAEWRPTATPIAHYIRSYHLSALYSPVGMQSWAVGVQKYLEAWDTENNRVRDPAAYQVFVNNVLGETYEIIGEQVRFDAVSAHRRHAYLMGQVPNRFARAHLGSPVLLLTCAVDVHIDNLAVAVIGWCRGRRAVVIDYQRFYGDTEQVDDPRTWGRLHELIARKFDADDGTKYMIQTTFIDSGYRQEQVYTFAQDYNFGVYPVKGRDIPKKNAKFVEFSEFETEHGTRAFLITVDHYKDRWSASLKRSWDGLSLQPEVFFNAPLDIEDKQLKELTVEVKREVINKVTRERTGFEWYRPSGARNELWDCLVYCDAALDILAADLCIEQLGMESVDFAFFYDSAEKNRTYIET